MDRKSTYFHATMLQPCHALNLPWVGAGKRRSHTMDGVPCPGIGERACKEAGVACTELGERASKDGDFKVPVDLGDLTSWFGDRPDVCAFFLAIRFNIGDPEIIGGNFLPFILVFNWVMTTCI
jgi:hypothetical protein